jgi:hypothetical protein
MKLSRQGDCTFLLKTILRCRCLRTSLAFLIVVVALAGTVCRATEALPAVQPPSAWVAPRQFDRPSPSDPVDPTQDYLWLLYDRQINAQNDEEFVHEVRQPLTLAGVQFASHVLINYDPTCQSLTFHWARLWRGTNKLDRLDPSTLRVDEPERDAKEWLFGSRITATLLLDDVRAGDIVDYAYTIEGRNPALGAKFCDAVQLQFKEPVERAVTRLVWPAGRPLYITNHLTSIQRTVSRKTNVIEFTWDARKVPGLPLQPLTPAGYDPYAWVQLTDFPKWSDVSRWASRFFATTNPPSPELARKISQWQQLPDPAARVTAALRCVQEEIRAPTPDEESASYEPAPPSVVLAHRFGDGKEKAFLLVAMLRALKIDAFPVLVNDRLRQELAGFLPSPILFNHVIVQVNLAGQSFWLEPTATYQRGLLTMRYWPSYAWGLKLGPVAGELTPIPPCPVQPLTTLSEYLNVAGLQAESTAKIVTVAEGPDADRLRQRLATTPREEVERENLSAYAKEYPFIRRTAPLVYADDEQQNRIEVTEYYALEKLWNRLQDESNFHFRIYAVNLDSALVNPADAVRTQPLAVPYPIHQIFHAEVNVTSSLPADSENVTMDRSAFYFHRTAAIVGGSGNLVLNFEYRSWTDAVAAPAMPAYVHDLTSVADSLAYTVIGLW